MEERSMMALSSVEFGSGTPPTDLWLHGSSESLSRLRRRCESTAEAGCRVIVITGAAGVGKHRLARWLHHRMAGPAVATLEIDGGAPPPQFAETTGTMIVSNAPAINAHTASALEQRIVRGDGTLILLSRTPLTELRERSLEHEQLFGRRTEAILQIPNLSARPQDIASLSRAALDDACRRYDLPTKALSPGALAALERQTWPGNARQLMGLLEQAALRATERWITPADLGLTSAEQQSAGTLNIRLPGASLREIEVKAVTLALELADGRIVRAAELLGITRHALRRKIDKFGVDPRPLDALDPNTSI